MITHEEALQLAIVYVGLRMADLGEKMPTELVPRLLNCGAMQLLNSNRPWAQPDATGRDGLLIELLDSLDRVRGPAQNAGTDGS